MKMRFVTISAAVAAVLLLPGTAHAQNVSFSKDLVPILREQCVKCHSTRQPSGGFAVSTFAAIEKGGKGGKALAPKPDDSRLIKYLEGTLQPKMPIGGSLTKEQIAKFRAWITQGGKSDVDVGLVVIPDSAIPAVKTPVIAVKVPVLPEALALAWSKDNKFLAIGTYKTVLIVDPSTGQRIGELKGHADKIHDLQLSPDGKILAAAGGPPAQQGEIKLWDTTTWKEIRTIVGHTDYIYSISWSPDNKRIATASYDKTIKVFDATTGSEVSTLKDHADAVYAVAFDPTGNLLASGSADRSVKVWDVKSGKRIYTLAGHTDTVYSLAWNPKGNQITSVGADKTVRTWNVNPQSGNQARNVTAHDKAVEEVAYSPDGNAMATVSDDKSVKIWNAANGSTTHHIKDLGDGLQSVVFSPDSKLIAIGGYDGTVRIINAADGKTVSTIIEMPKAAPAPAAKPPAAVPAKPTPAKTDAKPRSR